MKRLVLIFALALTFSTCTSKMPVNYTPQTKQLYVLTDMVDGVGALQLAAENAVPANILPLATARKIVQFTVAANTAIGQFPNGWFPFVNSIYVQLKASLSQIDRDNFQYAFDAFELILNSFAPQVTK